MKNTQLKKIQESNKVLFNIQGEKLREVLGIHEDYRIEDAMKVGDSIDVWFHRFRGGSDFDEEVDV